MVKVFYILKIEYASEWSREWVKDRDGFCIKSKRDGITFRTRKIPKSVLTRITDELDKAGITYTVK